jgi:hypothetical protein
MKRIELARLLKAAKRLTKHREYVLIGSLSILGSAADPPAEMVGSIDVDLYPRTDPGRIAEIAHQLGEGSAFHRRYGIYADPVSPYLAAGILSAAIIRERFRVTYAVEDGEIARARKALTEDLRKVRAC